MGMIESFEKMLSQGIDNPLLRFSLGSEYLKCGDILRASVHLRAAVLQDSAYSAAWKLLGKSLAQGNDIDGARDAYLRGIAAADANGDKQAAREMGIFLKRLG